MPPAPVVNFFEFSSEWLAAAAGDDTLFVVTELDSN
jgi:hypothetical protein